MASWLHHQPKPPGDVSVQATTMTGRLRTSRAGLELIKSFEGFRDVAIRLPDGRWTIGYGHVRTARDGLSITEKDAADLLVQDLTPIEAAIHALVFTPLNQNQFDALASLVFNIGPGRFRDSDVLRNLNAGDFLGAAASFDVWRKARIHGRTMLVDALVRRRTVEKALFLEHPDGRAVAPTPLVTPEPDLAMTSPPETSAAAPVASVPESSVDIAEAVRRLAERTSEIAAASGQPIPPPPPESDAEDRVQAAPSQPTEIETAHLAVAERIARILERTERAMAEQQSSPSVSTWSPRPADAAASRPASAAESVRNRPLIDDTETFDPGRDPAVMFAEAEQNAKIVQDRVRRMGLINTQLAVLAPWIAILVLSVIGLAIGLVDTFNVDAGRVSGIQQGAPTVLALFGMLVIMSIYFLATRSSRNDPA